MGACKKVHANIAPLEKTFPGPSLQSRTAKQDLANSLQELDTAWSFI
jgi:hypothetical protein